MKFNWGTGIFIFIILFFIAIFSFVFYTTTHEVNLVEQGYYPRGLEYDAQQEKMINTAGLAQKIRFEKSKEALRILFPDFINGDSVSGTIRLYRPSDYKKDILFNIQLDSASSQIISAEGLVPGKYIIKVDWSHMGINYYQEEVYIH